MSKRGKVGTSGREIQHSLYGTRGRPETNEYVDRCAEQILTRQRKAQESLRIAKQWKPAPAPVTPANNKWTAARREHGLDSNGNK